MNAVLKIGTSMCFALMVSQTACASEEIDLTTPQGAITASRKIHCSTTDNKPIFFSWEGKAYSHRMGEADKHLFNIAGMNVRQCVTAKDKARGAGYRLVSREIMLYLDPKTGEPLETWRNPLLGRDVNVIQVANDPVNQRTTYPYSKDGKPSARWYGRTDHGSWFINLTFPLFYHNELGGDYQKYVGGAYHATEMFNFMGEVDALKDPSKDTVDVKVGWVRIAQYLPWMEMQGREGMVYFHAAGHKVGGFDELPEVLKTYINTKAPIYRAPPAGDDKRPNQTSWSVFKDQIEGAKLPRNGF